MIKKLRKKLMFMFLSFTMAIFTLAMILMMSNTVVEVHNSEASYINNITDSILKEIWSGTSVDTAYLSLFDCYIKISDGITETATPERFSTVSDYLVDQLKAGKSLLSEYGIIDGSVNRETCRSLYQVTGQHNEKYYGIHSIFYTHKNTEYNLILFYPKSSVLNIISTYCSWYPLLWLGVLVLIYLVSRILIGNAVEPIEITMKSQRDFIASASHELKTPLAVIQANAETLEVSSTNPITEQKQKVILDECVRMSGLIKSMLALASSDSGNWKMDFRENDVDTILIEAWEEFSESARKKNIRLNLDMQDLFPKLCCDKERITQVLGILLDNAISYSGVGSSVELGAKVQAKQIVFSVIDHGCGIAYSEKEKVFERFYSGDPSRTDKNHYGLGLSIAREIVKLHQGTIRLSDTPGGGCTFEICLPIEKVS